MSASNTANALQKLPRLNLPLEPEADHAKNNELEILQKAHYLTLRFIASELSARLEGRLVGLAADEEEFSPEAFEKLYTRFVKTWKTYAEGRKDYYLKRTSTPPTRKDHKSDPALRLDSIDDWYKFLNLNLQLDPIARTLLHVLERAAAWAMKLSLPLPTDGDHFMKVEMLERPKLRLQTMNDGKPQEAAIFWLNGKNANWEMDWVKKFQTSIVTGNKPTERATARTARDPLTADESGVITIRIPVYTPTLSPEAPVATAAGTVPPLALDGKDDAKGDAKAFVFPSAKYAIPATAAAQPDQHHTARVKTRSSISTARFGMFDLYKMATFNNEINTIIQAHFYTLASLMPGLCAQIGNTATNDIAAMNALQAKFKATSYKCAMNQDTPLSCYRENVIALTQHWNAIKTTAGQNKLEHIKEKGTPFEKTILLLLGFCVQLKVAIPPLQNALFTACLPEELQKLSTNDIRKILSKNKNLPEIERIIEILDPQDDAPAKKCSWLCC